MFKGDSEYDVQRLNNALDPDLTPSQESALENVYTELWTRPTIDMNNECFVGSTTEADILSDLESLQTFESEPKFKKTGIILASVFIGMYGVALSMATINYLMFRDGSYLKDRCATVTFTIGGLIASAALMAALYVGWGPWVDMLNSYVEVFWVRSSCWFDDPYMTPNEDEKSAYMFYIISCSLVGVGAIIDVCMILTSCCLKNPNK